MGNRGGREGKERMGKDRKTERRVNGKSRVKKKQHAAR